ncbi:YbaB/EbfC family nucleoid-associated protein [Lentzea sp. NBRC 105346]|uniref:YbaB/EbfC family nucleoid-associated protein n=1 Tax=Lentzea sp. NBRC 105346 TaxID=3032205 RepID=UPI002552AC21|nr:YbaB/EbfC family nucleoid-associated protein [Lentzea sp. NBRC 105346]
MTSDMVRISTAIDELTRAEEELRPRTASGTSGNGGVHAVVSGTGELLSLRIADGALRQRGHVLRQVERDLVEAIGVARTALARLPGDEPARRAADPDDEEYFDRMNSRGVLE